MLGGGQVEKHLDIAANAYLDRDHSTFRNPGHVGTIFSPELFLTKPGTKKKKQNDGDETEKEFYEGLQRYCGKQTDLSGAVLHGLELFFINGENVTDYEQDFILVFRGTNMIINVEAKNSLSEDNGRSAKEQLKLSRDILQNNYGPVFSDETQWKVASLVYYSEREDDFTCDDCDPYILNKGNLEDRLDNLLEKQKGKSSA